MLRSTVVVFVATQIACAVAFAPLLPTVTPRVRLAGPRCVQQGAQSASAVLQPFQDRRALKVGARAGADRFRVFACGYDSDFFI